MKRQKLLALFLTLAMVLSLAACGASGGETAPTEEPAETPVAETPQPEEEPAEEPAEVAASGTQQAVIEGFDWGPAVTKTILTLDQVVTADSVTPECFAVT